MAAQNLQLDTAQVEKTSDQSASEGTPQPTVARETADPNATTELSTTKTDSTEKSKSDAEASSSSKQESKEETKEVEKSEGKSKSKSKDADKSDEKEKPKENPKLPKGMKAAVKTLFAKPAECKCCTTWVEENPDEANKSVEESDECLQHAIVVRKKKQHEGKRKPLKVDSIVIHSPLLKTVLGKLFETYPDLVIDLQELVFEAPFAPFFHRWEEFEKVKENESDETTKAHLTLLYDALALELKSVLQRHKDLVRHKVIDFDILWTLFQPGHDLYSTDDGHDRLYKITDCEYVTEFSGEKFYIKCQSIDWDGERFGLVNLTEKVPKFKGTKSITLIPSYPLEFHSSSSAMKKKCIERGRRFKSLAGVSCKDYNGTAIEYSKFAMQNVTNKRHLEGRIMLDEVMFSKFNLDEVSTLREIEDEDKDKEKEGTSAADEKGKKDDDLITKAVDTDNKADEVSDQDLNDNQLAICNSWLRGYSLAYQKWAAFAVDSISDVVWNNEAFKELALPEDYRELILATIQTQIQQKNSSAFDDFIRGKGRGYIMLFSGNPGVGKTATAESIAELLHVPLCMISVGNLGTDAGSVESSLQDILEIAAKWNAVLLLDEADIFLEQRTKQDLHRNAVVSVFLRLLEYYQGVLCLTTNRSEEIDVAFHSRIHISLPFPDLVESSREQVWRQFAKMTDKKAEDLLSAHTEMKKAAINGDTELVNDGTNHVNGESPQVQPNGDSDNPKADHDKTTTVEKPTEMATSCNISNSDFKKLAQYPLNGRQIKNAFKTAVLLASYKKEKVGIRHIKTALKTIDGFRKDQMTMYT